MIEKRGGKKSDMQECESVSVGEVGGGRGGERECLVFMDCRCGAVGFWQRLYMCA